MDSGSRANRVHGSCVAARRGFVSARSQKSGGRFKGKVLSARGEFSDSPLLSLSGECSGVLNVYQAKTLGIFLKRVAYDYARYGYTEYALREIPEGKDVAKVGQKLCEQYQVTRCRMARSRRKKGGQANVTLVMYRRWFVLLGTRGTHETFSRIVRRDLRTWPLHFMGYSVGMKGNTPWVMIAPRRWQRIEEIGQEIALHHTDKVHDFFHRFLEQVSGFRFPGVIEQKKRLLSEVNERRQRAGHPKIPQSEAWVMRRPDDS